MKETIRLDELNEVREEYLSDKTNTVMRHVLANTAISDATFNGDNKDNQFVFSIDIPTMSVCNQMKSGRCWIFSASTILREIIAKKLNIKDGFEISQNYISYFDKLEKYNYYMENVISLALKGEEKNSRRMHFLLSSGVGDGGQWDMFVDLVKKYGIVPKPAFPETRQSSNTSLSSSLANAALREFASKVYQIKDQGIDALHELKSEYVKKLYSLFTSSFGVPPTEFDFEYTDCKGEYHIEKGLTPKSFFEKYIGDEIDEYVSLINAPTKDKEYYQTYNVELVGNVLEGKPITHLNLPMERLEELIIEQLKNGEIVWFGSDVSYYGDRSVGTWDVDSYDFVTPFGLDFAFDKADMLDFHHSAMNHAMVITGVDLIDGKPVRWKIENSWGKDSGKNGYYLMSEKFFTLFAYQAAVKMKYLNEKEKEALKKKPVLLSPWDPFGTLAD